MRRGAGRQGRVEAGKSGGREEWRQGRREREERVRGEAGKSGSRGEGRKRRGEEEASVRCRLSVFSIWYHSLIAYYRKSIKPGQTFSHR